MAGDWIKVEHATLDKPEVLRTAEMLGVSTNECLGLFLRYFIWLDKNLSGSCPDDVRNVSMKSLDEFLRCPGFAACLGSVGWGSFDEKAWKLHIVNADRHNGTSAKSRSLDSKRKAEKRRNVSGSDPDKSGAEKRREEKRTTTTLDASRLVGQTPDADQVGPKKKVPNGRDLSHDAKALLAFLNEKSGKRFPASDSNVGILVARLREGFTPAQVRQVIAMKVRAWKTDEGMREYLRPKTLFAPSNFSNYVGELVPDPAIAETQAPSP